MVVQNSVLTISSKQIVINKEVTSHHGSRAVIPLQLHLSTLEEQKMYQRGGKKGEEKAIKGIMFFCFVIFFVLLYLFICFSHMSLCVKSLNVTTMVER